MLYLYTYYYVTLYNIVQLLYNYAYCDPPCRKRFKCNGLPHRRSYVHQQAVFGLTGMSRGRDSSGPPGARPAAMGAGAARFRGGTHAAGTGDPVAHWAGELPPLDRTKSGEQLVIVDSYSPAWSWSMADGHDATCLGGQSARSPRSRGSAPPSLQGKSDRP